MKPLCLAAALILTQVGCERHPATQTVPGYAEKLEKKKADENLRATTPETVNPDSPKFFPPNK